jgi:oligoribonuclease NrnB/cAMP/cGMP phosphodiesterase (DHH superfamily)
MNTTAHHPLVIYHGNCADGFSAAWCLWKKFGDAATYHPGVYGAEPPDVTGRDVYLVDFSYKHDVLLGMAARAHRVVVLDHHKSAMLDLQQLPQFDVPVDPHAAAAVSLEAALAGQPLQIACCFDMDRSGATLAWDFAFPGVPRPLLLGHVEDRDLWRFTLRGTREIQAFVFAHEYSFEQWDRLMAADQVELLSMTAAGAAIERKHHKDIAELVKVCQRRMVIDGHDVPVASLPYTMTSDAGHLMSVGQPFAACYWDTEDHRCFSLRSQPEGMDVSEVAKAFGGGGHANAAGFKVPRDHDLARQ